jgi:parafibromin
LARPLAIIMATDPTLSDPLLSLRRAIAAQALPTPTTSPDVATASDNVTDDLAKATHLYFTHPIPHVIPLNTSTRFVSAASHDTPVDLRSIFFAWQKKDVAIPEYIDSAQELNGALKQKYDAGEGEDEQVLNLVFVERLDLITWLEGASDESEYIKPLEGAAAAAAALASAAAAADVAPQTTADASVAIASGAAGVPTSAGAGGAVPATGAAAGAGARLTKVIDPRLQEIYNGERKLGDRNTVLRGIKPTVSFFFFMSFENASAYQELKDLLTCAGLFPRTENSRDLPGPQSLVAKPIPSRGQARRQQKHGRAHTLGRSLAT